MAGKACQVHIDVALMNGWLVHHMVGDLFCDLAWQLQQSKVITQIVMKKCHQASVGSPDRSSLSSKHIRKHA